MTGVQTCALPISYYVTTSNPFGCLNSDSVTINVWPLPTKPIISYIPPQLVSTPAVTYQWYLNAVPISGATNQTHTPIFNGDYTVIINDTNGCYNVSDIYNMTGMGIAEEHALDEILLYPNPNTGEFFIEFNTYQTKSASICLFDVTGQLVFSEHIDQLAGIYKKQINLTGKARGIYHLQLITPKGIFNRKVVFN